MKKHLLLNQSFGTAGSPNQTDETLTRENRIGLMSYLHRTLMLLFAVLVMSIANIGTVWGAEYTIYQATSSGVNTANVEETGISVTFNSMKAVSNAPITSVANAGYGIEAGLKSPRWGGSGNGNNIQIVVAENYTATITAYVQVKSANQTVTVKQTTESGTNITSVSCSATETVYQVQASDLAAGTYYIKANDNVGLIKLVASVTAAGGGGGGSGTGTGTISWAITTNTQTLTPTISGAGAAKLSNASTTLSLTGLSTTSSSKDGYCKPFYGTVVDCPANDDYASVTFTVASGYTFTPSSLSLTCFSHNNGGFKYKAVISDATYTITSNELQPSSGGEGAITFASGAFTGKALTGTVTIKLFTYGLASSSTGTRSYIKSPITITGTVAEAAACTAPNHVDVTGRWDRFAGETISLTATAYSSEGTGSPIAAGSITGYQWEKLVGTTWTALSNGTTDGVTTSGATTANLQIANCKATNSGKYRCVVSTGATCSTASATATDGTQGLGVKVFMLECYNDGTKTCSFTRTGDTQTGTATLTLAANTAYTFKFHVDNVYYGNNASINEDITNYVFCNSDNGGNCAVNFTVNSGLGGTFTFTMDYSTGGNSSVLGEPELSVTYPRKRIYLDPGVWKTPSDGEKFAYNYYRDGGSGGWTDFLTEDDCGMFADIPQWKDVILIPVRLKNTTVSPGSWDDRWNQTNNITVTSNDYVRITGWNASDFTYTAYSTPTYTISYNAGTGGSGSKASESKTCGVDFTLPGSTFTYAGHTQDGWATTDGGAIAYALSGSYTTNDDEEFFPHWKCNTPTITDNGDNTVTITVPSGTTVRYTTDGSTPTSSSGTIYSSAIDIAANVTVKAIAYQSNCTDSEVASQACTYHAPASLTALECNTLYKAEHMVASSITSFSSTEQFAGGLSSNARFEVLGTGSTNATGGPMGAKNDGATISETTFSNSLYFKGTGNKSGEIPTSRGIKFIVPNAGKLDIYVKGPGGINIVKEGGSGTAIGSGDSNAKVTVDVTAGTYYLYATASSRTLFGIQLNCCSTPAAPTAFTAGSITSTGATFTITDAANAASYDIYYSSTSSTAPNASTPATTTSTEKTKAVTGLTANTTYYAWVRSVCDADHKSAWFALGTTSFTTSAAEPTALVTWQMKVDQAAWALKSGTTEDGTNITSIASTADEPGSTSTGITGTTGKVVMASGESNVDKATSFTFTVNSAKKVVPEKVTCKVLNVSSGDRTYKAQLSDNNGHVYYSTNTVSVTTENVLTDATFNFASDLVLTGNVTLKVYAWKTSGSPTQFRMGEYVKLFGEVQDADPVVTHSVTHSLTNVTATSGATGASAATEGVAYNAVFAANTGYVLPSTITVTIDGSPATVGTGYTWNASTGAFQVPAAQVTGDIVVTIAGETAPATKDIYYGHVKITDGALVREIPSGATQFFTNIGGTVANNTEISLSSTPSTTGMYYNSNNLTDTELSKSSNWGTSSGSNRYVRGLKFANGATYTLALGTKVASAITFYGWCGSSSKTMTVGGEEFTSSATKETFAKHVFSKSGGFTDNVSITENGDFYGILVITIQTAAPCTTPELSGLSDKNQCPGDNPTAWTVTVDNAATITAAGESIAYSWKKKGNDTELATTASFDVSDDVTEGQAGTYVVTVTVSKASKAPASASAEVDLTVTAAVEEPSISSNKATVYAGNSVTLTATCGTAGVTWNWYKCTAADGSGAGSSLATTEAYTFTAPEVGTHYYKATASTSGTCASSASAVYTLTVSEASGTCNMMTIFDGSTMSSAPASTSGSEATSGAAWTAVGTATEMSGTVSMEYSGKTYTKGWKFTGGATTSSSRYIQIVIPTGYTGDLVMNGFIGSTSRSVFVATSPTGTLNTSIAYWSPATTTTLATASTRLSAGTYYVCATNSAFLTELSVNVCGDQVCTDEKPTATATNNTVCSGSKLTITATGYESDPTSIQWQKKNGESWDNISGATSATYSVASAAAADAGTYRVQVTKGCTRNSNEVTIAVPSEPVFGAVPASVNVMQTIALSISTVEATDATKYKWYKSADATWDAGDTEIGTNKELIKAYDGEATGSPSYYIFCRAQNSCGITTSTAIEVNVTAYVEEDCATRGNESDAEFGFENTGSVGTKTYNDKEAWRINSGDKYLTYSAPSGKYLASVTFHIAHDNDDNGAYGYSTDNGANWTYVRFTGLTTSWADQMINLSAISSSITDFRIGRKLGSYGNNSGSVWIYSVCFKYTDACTATTVTPSTESTSYVMGGEWSNPTFTLSVAGTLSYSSSNEDIASVDDDGTVTFNGDAGTVTITAAYAGNATYCASEGSYTITVTCPGGAPKVVASGTTVGCSSSITLQAKKQDDTAFDDGTYQWFRNGEEIDGATSSSYTATQAGTYTVERTNTSDCTTPSTNSAVVTSTATEPEVERLVPFQYYHVNKTYSDKMKMRHLFAVKNSGTLEGKHFKMYVSRNGGAANDVTSSNALVVVPNGDGHVDTVMVDLNKLSGKYSEGDELVFTCKAINCSGYVSDVYKNTITMNVIGSTPTLALICSGSNEAGGTRETKKLTVGGDFLTGYNKADLCEQTGSTSFDANTEWGLYTELKEHYIVTPVNGYAVFNKLNYEPFDILLLTDYPKASKSTEAALILDDMADLCDYRPMLSFKTHMVQPADKLDGRESHWKKKGFTTQPEVPKQSRLRLNIVCYAHPMFEEITEGVANDYDDESQIVYTMLSGPGHESEKGMQGFHLAAAENFVTIGLVHYNATATDNYGGSGNVKWTPGSGDEMLVAAAERQTNLEARFILFSLNCGAQSKLTAQGNTVVLKCLEYLLNDATIEGNVADCELTFDNKAGDHKWSNKANWAPKYSAIPGEYNSTRIAAPATVDLPHAKVMSVRIKEGGSIYIPAGSALDVKSTVRHKDVGSDVRPTDVDEIHIGSDVGGNGTLIFNNNTGDTKARVDMYSTAKADVANMSAATSTWQYIGTPHSDVANARSNYYDSWLYQYSGSGWEVIPNGGPLEAFRGYCITNETAPVVYDMAGTLAATTTQDIAIPVGYTVIANSWVAPIDINAITNDDMEGITDKTIYFFNTGTDADGTAGTGTEAGTYKATPIHSASYTGDWQIPSMQGFYISTTSAGTLHLDYDRHVRPTGTRTIVSNPMYAPRRATAESDEPNVLKIFARGSRYQDKLVVLEREDFTRGYDSGWDGEAWGGGTLSPMVYVTGEGREDAVSAIPEFEGTVIAFKAGEDEAYTLHFEYLNSDEPLYLLDTENNTYTQIMTGNAYYFTTSDKSKHARFILTRKSPQIATGVGNVSGDEVQGTKAKKLLIEDKMFIMVNGVLYDATGKVVK